MSKEIESQLISIGLSKNEQRVYLFLLKNGESSPSQIAKGSGIARTNLYYVLDQLIEKALIRPQIKPGQKRKTYLAEDPSLLLALHDRKRERIAALLPEITTLYEARPNKPQITFYEGEEEIKKIYLQTLSANHVFALGSTKELSARMPAFYDEYFRSLKKHGVILKDILSHSSQDSAAPQAKKILKSLYDVWVLPETYGDVPTDILVWKDNVAIISLGEPLFGTLLTHPQIAETFRIIMRVLHQHLERV